MRRMIVICLVLVLVSPGFAQAMADASVSDEFGRVEILSGASFLVRENGRHPLSEGTALRAGDRLETSGTGTVNIIQNDGVVYVGASSSLILASSDRIGLLEGTLRIRVQSKFSVVILDREEIRVSGTGADFAVRYSDRHVRIVPMDNFVFYKGRVITPGILAESHMGGALHMTYLNEDNEENESYSTAESQEVVPLGYTKPTRVSENDVRLGKAWTVFR